MALNDLEQTYAQAKEAFDRHTQANSMPSYDDLHALESVVYAVSIRHGVMDWQQTNDSWTVHAYFSIDNRRVHVTGHGDTLCAAAVDLRKHIQNETRWQGLAHHD